MKSERPRGGPSMMRKTVVAGLVATSLLAGMIGVVGSASAATDSELTVTPIEPGVADVCWTPYDPTPQATSVINYRLSAPDLLDIPITAPPSTFADGHGRYCVHFSNLPSGKRYTFMLEAQTNDYVWTDAAPDLVAHYFALSADLSRTHVKVGQKVTVSGTLKQGSKGQKGATVIVQRRAMTSDTWSEVGRVTTNSRGHYTRTFKVRANVKVRTYFMGMPGVATVGAWNSNNPIEASPVFNLSFAKNPVRRGQKVRASGSVKAGSVQLLAGDPVCFQQKQGRSWHSLKCVPISSTGRFSYVLTPKSRADVKYRWRASSVAPDYVAGNSRSLRLVVH